jgi:phasin family protein
MAFRAEIYFVHCTIFLLISPQHFYIVHCNMRLKEANMAQVRRTKTIKSVAVKAVAPAKAVAAPKVRKPRAVAQAAETKTVFSKPINDVIEGTKTMTDTVTDTVKQTAAEAGEKVTSMFKDVSARAKAGFAKVSDFGKEGVEFQKANIEAVVEAGKVAAKGTQTAAERAAELTRKNWEATTAHAKALTAVKSPTDFFKLQSDFARGQMDGAVAEFSKTSEFTLKLMGEIFAPIQNRYVVASEQVKARMAA